jgi:hypothetical protein
MEGINQMSKSTTLERKVKLFNTLAHIVLRSDKFVRQHLDANAKHIVFEDDFNNMYAIRLVQNTKDNNYEVALALRNNGIHLGAEKIKSRKHFTELLKEIENKTILANKALEHIRKQ